MLVPDPALRLPFAFPGFLPACIIHFFAAPSRIFFSVTWRKRSDGLRQSAGSSANAHPRKAKCGDGVECQCEELKSSRAMYTARCPPPHVSGSMFCYILVNVNLKYIYLRDEIHALGYSTSLTQLVPYQRFERDRDRDCDRHHHRHTLVQVARNSFDRQKPQNAF